MMRPLVRLKSVFLRFEALEDSSVCMLCIFGTVIGKGTFGAWRPAFSVFVFGVLRLERNAIM